MQKNPELHEVLYVSTLAPESPVKVVSQIAAQARRANEASGITGLLIFDGMRFCQQIEGPHREVLALIQRIRLDSRHIGMQVLHQGALEARRFRRFSLGYAAVDDQDVLAQIENSDPGQAMTQFLALIPSLDLDS
jgi:hypothetical protein